jgi:RimJ/RimL family protein N-acetyltransferase
MSPDVLRHLLARDQAAAESLLGAPIAGDLDISDYALEMRLAQLDDDPGLQPWLLRALVLRDHNIVIGTIGCHTAPGPEYLAELSPGAVEFGFGIIEPWRRQRFAAEASQALMRWAHDHHHVTRFILSISPENSASLGLAAHLGFSKIGSHLDEIDGPEDIFEKSYHPE